MKKFSLLLVAVLISGMMYGQFHIGPQIGYTASKLSYNGSDITNDLKSNMLIGVFARIGKKIYLQPEINYMTQGSVFKFPSLSNTSVVEQDVSLKSIQVPLSLGWRFLNLKIVKFRIFGGATANFVVDKTIDTKNGDPKDYLLPDDFDDIQWQYQLGLGVDIAMFAIDIKYYGGINDLFNGTVQYDNVTHSVTGAANAFEVTVGWKIF
ncbi:PorT family protein [Candidatus Sulfidibacterium hydrothermale]|uniref:porin family protein n=1 Tax=Candidatus Sulfidibacterium hydrothermale TaxID=2875962 RepID=UPI001F0A6BAF|nr:porin family protein [Candidatus Sulfidibacterium hydrothermale]UBM62593.1 PorT family protein [Candidatus Sulfidibacterium hydrothermale]